MSIGLWSRGRIHDQRPHHVVLFVLQDVAVPYIFVVALQRSARVLAGTVNGTVGRSNFMITRVTSPGFMRTVSFQPR